MDTVTHIIKQIIPQMSSGEKEELLSCLVEAIDRELVDRLTEDGNVHVCPRCGSSQVTKKGRKGGKQRYRCKGCERSFSSATRRVLALSKLERDVWVAYARCMVAGLSLRECAAQCGVGLKTSWFMRIRVCQCMEGRLDAFRADSSCTAEIDEYYLRESFQGNHALSGSFSMPRKARRRPGDGAKRGVSNDLICVLTGINDRGAVFLEVAARGALGKEEARAVLEGKVAEGAIVSTDRHRSYEKLMPELGAAVHNRFDSKDRGQGVINAVNSLHARLDAFLAPFNGVSTRRLHHYLMWFKWVESFRLRLGKERADIMAGHIANGCYDLRIRDCWRVPHPFGDYWGLPC